MSTEKRHIDVRGVRVEIDRKDIKNLHIGVYPPNGRVRAATPLHLDDEAVRLAVVSRLSWIKKQQESFKHQERQTKRDMVSGESHFFKGKRYRLDVVEAEGKQEVRLINNNTMQIKVRPGAERDKKLAILQKWYRQQLRNVINEIRPKWEQKMEVQIAELGIKIMKTKWGSCNIEDRRIWLNLELAKKPESCIEYILVHEMMHFYERHHTERFSQLMDYYLPDWRLRRDELNKSPLAHEEWKY
jgi:predicted metal-dependent hydrolase